MAASVDDFLSGESGTVGGIDRRRRRALDRLQDACERKSPGRRALARAIAQASTPRRILVLGSWRAEHLSHTRAIRAELSRTRHDVHIFTTAPDGHGRFEVLNMLLSEAGSLRVFDWLLLVDDDVELPAGFLDAFIFLAEHFALDLAQPAHARSSHAAWKVTRRRWRSLVRETRFVEIGPVCAFAHTTFSELLPFPPLRMGWGLDAHWAALVQLHGWRCGVIDALAVRHDQAPAASAYSRAEAIAEARRFLADRPYLPASECAKTLRVHRRL
jgi:hypothetical protein